MITFGQGQIILNSYYALSCYPFLQSAKPRHVLSETELEAMLDRIRQAKAELIPAGVSADPKTFAAIKARPVGFSPTGLEVTDILLALDGVLREGRSDPRNIEPLIGANLTTIESLVWLLSEKASE